MVLSQGLSPSIMELGMLLSGCIYRKVDPNMFGERCGETVAVLMLKPARYVVGRMHVPQGLTPACFHHQSRERDTHNCMPKYLREICFHSLL